MNLFDSKLQFFIIYKIENFKNSAKRNVNFNLSKKVKILYITIYQFSNYSPTCFELTRQFFNFRFQSKHFFIKPVLSYSAVNTTTWQHYSATFRAYQLATADPAGHSSNFKIFAAKNIVFDKEKIGFLTILFLSESCTAFLFLYPNLCGNFCFFSIFSTQFYCLVATL